MMAGIIESTWQVDADLSALGDPALLALVRSGNAQAYGVLFDRYHGAAMRLARRHCRSWDAQDTVAESFVQTLDLLRRGKGPDEFFRAYLFTSVRREAWRRARAAARTTPVGDQGILDRVTRFDEGAYLAADRDMVKAAFAALPPRWRSVLWSLDVEGRKPQELDESMGMTPNGVSALAYRAREGLRQAYLDQHLNTNRQLHDAICESILHSLARVVRDAAAPRETSTVVKHLEACTECEEAFQELVDVNADLSLTRPLASSVGA